MTSARCYYCDAPALYFHARHDNGKHESLCRTCYEKRWHPPLSQNATKARRRGRPTKEEAKSKIFPISLNSVQRFRLEMIAIGEGKSSRQLASEWVQAEISSRWRSVANIQRRTVRTQNSPTSAEPQNCTNAGEATSKPNKEPFPVISE